MENKRFVRVYDHAAALAAQALLEWATTERDDAAIDMVKAIDLMVETICGRAGLTPTTHAAPIAARLAARYASVMPHQHIPVNGAHDADSDRHVYYCLQLLGQVPRPLLLGYLGQVVVNHPEARLG